jgi:hypothetical protein
MRITRRSTTLPARSGLYANAGSGSPVFSSPTARGSRSFEKYE